MRLFSVARSVRLPRPGSYPAHRPMECGLSSMAEAIAVIRPAWDIHHTIFLISIPGGRGHLHIFALFIKNTS